MAILEELGQNGLLLAEHDDALKETRNQEHSIPERQESKIAKLDR